MKFLNSTNVLCIGAHPDDVEYGMAGTFQKCEDTNFTVAVMSNGGDWDVSTNVNRQNENMKVWESFHNVNGVVDAHEFVKERHEDDMINFIETQLDMFNLVVTPPQEDSHFEHRIINNLGPALCRRSPTALVEYRTPSTLNHWTPNHFVALSKYNLKNKKKVLSKFTSQQHAPYFSKECINSFHHNFLCSKRGVPIVESYRIVESYNIT